MLHELASVLGRGRAAAVVHPDVEATAKPRCALLTAFVALQDFDADMGPTVFTHARAVHRAPAVLRADGEARTAKHSCARPRSCAAARDAARARRRGVRCVDAARGAGEPERAQRRARPEPTETELN